MSQAARRKTHFIRAMSTVGLYCVLSWSDANTVRTCPWNCSSGAVVRSSWSTADDCSFLSHGFNTPCAFDERRIWIPLLNDVRNTTTIQHFHPPSRGEQTVCSFRLRYCGSFVARMILRDRGNRHTTVLPILDPETSKVLVRTSWRVYLSRSQSVHLVPERLWIPIKAPHQHMRPQSLVLHQDL